jgi:hypothetical protein
MATDRPAAVEGDFLTGLIYRDPLNAAWPVLSAVDAQALGIDLPVFMIQFGLLTKLVEKRDSTETGTRHLVDAFLGDVIPTMPAAARDLVPLPEWVRFVEWWGGEAIAWHNSLSRRDNRKAGRKKKRRR